MWLVDKKSPLCNTTKKLDNWSKPSLDVLWHPIHAIKDELQESVADGPNFRFTHAVIISDIPFGQQGKSKRLFANYPAKVENQVHNPCLPLALSVASCSHETLLRINFNNKAVRGTSLYLSFMDLSISLPCFYMRRSRCTVESNTVSRTFSVFHLSFFQLRYPMGLRWCIQTIS